MSKATNVNENELVLEEVDEMAGLVDLNTGETFGEMMDDEIINEMDSEDNPC